MKKYLFLVTIVLFACTSNKIDIVPTIKPTSTSKPTATSTPTNTPLPTNTPKPVMVEFDYFQADGIRSQPKLSSNIFREVNPGDKLLIISYQEKPHKVYFVRLEDGTEGWLFWKTGMFEPLEDGQITTIQTTPTRRPAPRPTSRPVCTCSSDTYNCSDFKTQAEAQRCMNLCPGDIHQLDSNNDGKACETLP